MGRQVVLPPFFIAMNTVHNFLHIYCAERNLPPPSRTDLESCGKMISYHFKHFWIPQIGLEDGALIENAGYVVQQLDDKKIVVQYYPESFKSDMADRCDYFFKLKNKRIAEAAERSKNITETPAENTQQPRQRKRINSPEKKPAYSTKNFK